MGKWRSYELGVLVGVRSARLVDKGSLGIFWESVDEWKRFGGIW